MSVEVSHATELPTTSSSTSTSPNSPGVRMAPAGGHEAHRSTCQGTSPARCSPAGASLRLVVTAALFTRSRRTRPRRPLRDHREQSTERTTVALSIRARRLFATLDTAVAIGGRGRTTEGRNAKSPPARGWWALRKEVRRCPTLPQGLPRSTIGAESLSFRVRNVTGRFPLAMAAETLWMFQSYTTTAQTLVSGRGGVPTVHREPQSGREQQAVSSTAILMLNQ